MPFERDGYDVSWPTNIFDYKGDGCFSAFWRRWRGERRAGESSRKPAYSRQRVLPYKKKNNKDGWSLAGRGSLCRCCWLLVGPARSVKAQVQWMRWECSCKPVVRCGLICKAHAGYCSVPPDHERAHHGWQMQVNKFLRRILIILIILQYVVCTNLIC